MHTDAVLFDVDDTLCRYRRTGDELLAVAFERPSRKTNRWPSSTV